MKKTTMMTTVFAGLLAATTLQAKTYTCQVSPDSSLGWISETLVFNIDDASGEIRVFDGIIGKYVGKPVEGKLSVETAKRRTITWTTRRVRDDYGNSTARFLFRASYYKDSGKMIISAIPGGWDNRFGGRGRCVVTGDAGWAAALNTAQEFPFTARGKSPFYSAGDADGFPPWVRF